jgi:ERCC4-related helicase
LLATIEKIILEQAIVSFLEVGTQALHIFIENFFQTVVQDVGARIKPQINDIEKDFFSKYEAFLRKLIFETKEREGCPNYSKKFQKLCNIVRQNLESNINQNIIIFVEMRYVAKMLAYYLTCYGI